MIIATGRRDWAHDGLHYEAVRAGIWALALPLVERPIGYSIGYVIEDVDGALHLIDPGWDNEENWSRLTGFLDYLGRGIGDIRTVTSTHLHPDHLGLSGRLAVLTGGEVIMHTVEAEAFHSDQPRVNLDVDDDRLRSWGVPKDQFDRLSGPLDLGALPELSHGITSIADGDLLPIPGRRVEAVWTPGHTSGHLCFRDLDEQLLYTGDHVLPTINPGLGLGGWVQSNPILDYFQALEKVTAFDDHEILPGHEFRFRGLAERCESLAANHMRRAREVRDVLAEHPGSGVWETATRLRWRRDWNTLPDYHAVSALAQTQLHMEFVASPEAAHYFDSDGDRTCST